MEEDAWGHRGSPLALTVWRANMRHNKGTIKRVTAYCAAWASIQARRALRKQARANRASQASFPSRVVTMRRRTAKPAGRVSTLRWWAAFQSPIACRVVWASTRRALARVPQMYVSRVGLEKLPKFLSCGGYKVTVSRSCCGRSGSKLKHKDPGPVSRILFFAIFRLFAPLWNLFLIYEFPQEVYRAVRPQFYTTPP